MLLSYSFKLDVLSTKLSVRSWAATTEGRDPLREELAWVNSLLCRVLSALDKASGTRSATRLRHAWEGKRYAEVFKKVVAVFGNAEGARNWSLVPNPALDGQMPLELAGSAEGAARIQTLLG